MQSLAPLKRGDPVDETLTFSGRAIVEDMNYMRVLVGRLAVHEIARIFDEHGDQLLQRNIRRHLGHANRINQEIRQTLLAEDKADKFYFYNNGVTMVCDRFVYNAFAAIRLPGASEEPPSRQWRPDLQDHPADAARGRRLLRRHRLRHGAPLRNCRKALRDVVRDITKATNSQNAGRLARLAIQRRRPGKRWA